MYNGLHVKYPLVLYCNVTWIFSTSFRKVFKYHIYWKSVKCDPSSMRTDRRDEANSRFSQFCERA